MNTTSSVVAIVLVLAAIFLPQVLAAYIYHREWRKPEHEEYVPDGR